MLWAILDRGKALSSLTTDDAIAFCVFLRRPSPRERGVGPARPRTSAEWRRFSATAGVGVCIAIALQSHL